MSDLTEFLLARFNEDEAKGADWLARPEGSSWQTQWLVERVLADVEAKRRIVEREHPDGRSGEVVDPFCATCSDDECLVDLPCPTLRHLASVYSDHPNYDPSWRV